MSLVIDQRSRAVEGVPPDVVGRLWASERKWRVHLILHAGHSTPRCKDTCSSRRRLPRRTSKRSISTPLWTHTGYSTHGATRICHAGQRISSRRTFCALLRMQCMVYNQTTDKVWVCPPQAGLFFLAGKSIISALLKLTVSGAILGTFRSR